MNLPAQINGVENASLPPRPLHLAIGMFDGIHRGHRAVIDAAVQTARSGGALSGVLTFWPHPSALFRPDQPTRLIQPPDTKARMLAGLGIDVVITQPFGPGLAAIEAEDFLPWLVRALPHVSAVYVGANFRFGRGRRGDVAVLVAAGQRLGVQVFSAPRVSLDGEPISSTRIRARLEAGDMAASNSLLGYTYFAHGIVAPGKRLGRTIGFPTLNVPWAPDLRPRLGVYVVRIAPAPTVPGATSGWLPAVANYGVRPTVETATEPRLEVHVLGPCALGEGDHVKVEWLRFLRPEMKFPGLDALQGQIARDRDDARAYFDR
ncbi:MAG: riboflavin biosynthesis protein RibF [Opitutaceae bacterium]|nr:riboflavin biosynthesis protein RibF [Opitutaceae bacterium]